MLCGVEFVKIRAALYDGRLSSPHDARYARCAYANSLAPELNIKGNSDQIRIKIKGIRIALYARRFDDAHGASKNKGHRDSKSECLVGESAPSYEVPTGNDGAGIRTPAAAELQLKRKRLNIFGVKF